MHALQSKDSWLDSLAWKMALFAATELKEKEKHTEKKWKKENSFNLLS